LIKFNFSGSYYDNGYQLGNRLKNFFQLPPASNQTIEFAQECRMHVKQYAPGILDELQGLCDATGFDSGLLDAFVLSLGKDMIDQTREMFRKGIDFGCSSIAISGEHSAIDSPIFARNYDWMETFKKFFTVVWNTPKGGVSNISFTDHIVGRYGGINKAGLAMSIHGIPSYETEWVPGLRMNIIARWILDNFKTAKEAINFFEKIPHICGHIYLIADKWENIACIETAKEEVIVTDSKEGFMAITNQFKTKSLKKHEYKNFRIPNSQERLKKIQDWYKNQKSKITIDEIKHILSSHDDGVCNHFEFGGETTSTIWSWIAKIGTDEIFISDGSPCAHPYEKMKF
jgi:predicted choloylglycine hydrolase